MVTMKLLICFMIIFAHINNNSKASLDSFAPSNLNILLEDTTRNSEKSCHRPCKLNVKPRRCHYTFKIEPTIQEDGRPAIAINGLSPGPSINVCANDIIIVEVTNKIPDQDLAIHWHGIEHRGTPYMDGVPMITQCPIAYGSTFKYAFIASTPGTFFYHSDSVSQQSDGVYGVLIVNQPQPFEPHSSLYDFDRSNEHLLLVAAKFPELLTGNLKGNKLLPTSLVINGDDNVKLFMLPGYAYRLRLINALVLDCPIVMSIDQHQMTVIASDGRAVKPASAKKVKLYPGERMDVVVRASGDKGGYWINMRAEGACAGLNAQAMFLYSGYNYTSMLAAGQKESELETANLPLYGQMLESNQENKIQQNVKSVYVGIDWNTAKFKDTDNDFRYYFDSLPKKPFFPAPLSLRETGVVQINNKSFLYPSVPVLLYGSQETDNWCVFGEEEKNENPQCVLVLNAKEGDVLELALVNEGAGSNESYTFHMHGYGMQVVATGQSPNGTELSKEKFQLLDNEGKIQRSLQRPVIKDTVTVPNKGYTIVRIRPNYGGSWLLECRSCGLTLPTAILINVPRTIPKSIVGSLPKCGSFKPPDLLLN